MGPEAVQTLNYSKDSPPKTNGNGDLRKWKNAVLSWSTMHDKLLENNLKGTPKSLRGLILLGQLSGSARTIASHIPNEILQSDEGLNAIIDAVAITDPVTEAQRLYNAWEKLNSTSKAHGESYSKYMQRFRSNWSELEQMVEEKIPAAMQEQVSFQLLRGSKLSPSDMAQILTAAMRAHQNKVPSASAAIRSGFTSTTATGEATKSTDTSAKVAALKEAIRVSSAGAEATSERNEAALKNVRAAKDALLSIISGLQEESEVKRALQKLLPIINDGIIQAQIADVGIQKMKENTETLNNSCSQILYEVDQSTKSPIQPASIQQGSSQGSRKPLVTIESMSTALLTMDATNFERKGRQERTQQTLMGALKRCTDVVNKGLNTKKGANHNAKQKQKKIDKSRDKCKGCGKIGHWRNDPECEFYDPSKDRRRKFGNHERKAKPGKPINLASDSDSESDDEMPKN